MMTQKREPYLPSTDPGKVLYLNNFALKIPIYATALNITAAQVTSHQNDAAMFSYMVSMQETTKTFKQDVTAYKNFLRDGEDGPPQSEPVPVFPTLPVPPTTVNKGIFSRNSRAVANIKSENAYTTAMGEALGIVGDEHVVNVHQLKPVLKSRLEDGHPIIIWTKGVADSVDIYVDRKDSAGFVFLATDSHPDYKDTFPLPQGVESVIWEYKAIYNIGDEHVGHLSDPIEVTVSNQS